ncbi:MAG: hypothetical protein ACRDUW_19130 [Pseudonocardiaceae bacterium]
MAGIAFILSVITRTCAGPICPAANAAAVFGSKGRGLHRSAHGATRVG